MKKKVLIFGNREIAQLANYYFETDSAYEVVAFVVDKDYLTGESFENKPLLDFETIEKKFPPGDCSMFIAVSYAKMNSIRERKYFEAKAKGYNLVSYVSSRTSYLSQYPPGDNCFIFEDNTIQPFVKIGNNVTLWSGNHIGHHSTIMDHNFISSHVVISGHCRIEPNCFLGVNSTVAHKVKIGRETLVGAGAIITADTAEKSVYVPARSVLLNKKSDEFIF